MTPFNPEDCDQSLLREVIEEALASPMPPSFLDEVDQSAQGVLEEGGRPFALLLIKGLAMAIIKADEIKKEQRNGLVAVREEDPGGVQQGLDLESGERRVPRRGN